MNDNFFVTKDKFFHKLDDSIVRLLIKYKSTKKNIIWATTTLLLLVMVIN